MVGQSKLMKTVEKSIKKLGLTDDDKGKPINFSKKICKRCFLRFAREYQPENPRDCLFDFDFKLRNNWDRRFDMYWAVGSCLCRCDRHPLYLTGPLPEKCRYLLEQTLAVAHEKKVMW